MEFTFQLFSSGDESLKDETRLLLLWDGSLVTLHILCSYIFIHASVVKPVQPVHIFMARNRVSKSYLMVELCFHHFMHFHCVPIHIYIYIYIYKIYIYIYIIYIYIYIYVSYKVRANWILYIGTSEKSRWQWELCI